MTPPTTTVSRVGLSERIRAVPRPEPVLSREQAAALTPRQRELLDQLTALAKNGFSHLTMADLAGRLNCSLRTLYGLAPRREDLVLMALDRNLWSVGRAAIVAIEPAAQRGPLAAIQAYLAAANQAVSRTTPAFARDLASVPGGPELSNAHNEYLVAVTAELLDAAVESGEISEIDTPVVARAMASLGQLFSGPDVIDRLSGSPKDAADHVVHVILRGLVAPAHIR